MAAIRCGWNVCFVLNQGLLGVLDQYCTPIDGVLKTIHQLREEGILIGSTTGYTREMMDIVEPKSKELGYAPDYVVTSDMTGCGRPYPYMVFEKYEKIPCLSALLCCQSKG